MTFILLILAILSAFHVIVPCIYYTFMKRIAEKRSWNLSSDENYEPTVTVIVPTYNEAHVIVSKLQNLEKLDYPRDKLEVILVDSASTDGTAEITERYIKNNGFPFRVTILKEEQRRGKAKALNFALRYATGDIIATSDADAYWEPSALREALPYMACPQVGALTGREFFININQNSLTLAEDSYRKFYNILRLGESKLGSTLIFQGELSLYKRGAFEKFEDEKGSDDTGTVIDIVSRGYRSIFVPSVIFYDAAPPTWRGRLTVKTRRAQHLIYALTKAVKLKIRGKLKASATTTFMNLYLHTVNPVLSIALLISIVFTLWGFPLFLVIILLPFLIKKFRALFISYVTSHSALLLAIVQCIRGNRQIIWRKVARAL